MGEVNIWEMLSKISWLDFLAWRAYYYLDPFDEWRADMRAATIASQIGNLFAKSPKPIDAFALKFDDKPVRKQTWQEQKMIAKMYAYAFASSGKKKKKKK